jgi:uncharacterized membrane protein HdeD (DUF308 family)
MTTEIHEHVGRSWAWIVLRGVASVLFGLLAVAQPGVTLAALVLMWGAYAIADGILAIVAGWRIRDHGRPLWSLFVAGVLGIAAGVLTFRWPGVTALALLVVIAAWSIGVGALQIVAAIRLRKLIEGEWALGLSGVLSMAFGVLAVIHPGAGAVGVLWMIAANAIGFGVLLIVGGFRLRSYRAPKLVAA